jgi:hypothetical protein
VQDILEAFYLYHYHHTLTLPPEKTVSEPEKHFGNCSEITYRCGAMCG